MEQLILILHVLAAVALIGLILLQQGKGAEMGASFGSGASQTLFGSTGTVGFLARATSFLAFFFFLTSFGLAILASDKAKESSEFRVNVPAAEEVPVNVQELLQPDAGSLDVPVVPGDEPAPAPAEETPAILQEALEAEAARDGGEPAPAAPAEAADVPAPAPADAPLPPQ